MAGIGYISTVSYYHIMVGAIPYPHQPCRGTKEGDALEANSVLLMTNWIKSISQGTYRSAFPVQ